MATPPASQDPGEPADWATSTTMAGTPATDQLYIRSQLFQARMKAHDVLQEHLKQIITIASATLALTVTFLKDVVGVGDGGLRCEAALTCSWFALGVSIFLGTFALAAQVNHLDSARKIRSKAFKAGEGVVRPLNLGALSFFAVGMFLLGWFAFRNSDALLHKQHEQYQIGSALTAARKATSMVPGGSTVTRVSTVNLLSGPAGSPGSDVWHVVVETSRPAPATPAPATPVHPPPKPCTPSARRKKTCINPVVVPPSAVRTSESIDYYIDAKTGAAFP